MNSQEREKAETALRALDTLRVFGDLTKPLWSKLTDVVEAWERGVPGDLDKRYTVPSEAPSIGAHFIEGIKPQVLSAHVLWPGYHYCLSPGQRKWFREEADMTPTETVTVTDVVVWPNTPHPRSFKIVSDPHVPNNRKHVVKECIISHPGEFFAKSAEFDAEERVEPTLSLHVGPCKNFGSIHRWAVEDLVNVKFGATLKNNKPNRVEITMVNDEEVTFQDATGKRATVDRNKFLATVTDYDRLHDDRGAKRRKAPTVGQISETTLKGLDSLVDSLDDIV